MVSLATPVTLRPSGSTPVSKALVTLKAQVKQEAFTTVPAEPKPPDPTYPMAPAEAGAGARQLTATKPTTALKPNLKPVIYRSLGLKNPILRWKCQVEG